MGHSRRSKKKKRKLMVAAGAACLCIIIVVALLIYKDQIAQSAYKVDGKGVGEVSQSNIIHYKGKTYEYNNALQCLLLIGVDSKGKLKRAEEYGVDARADNIDLVILDRRKKTVKILPISRDTMTLMNRFSAKGYATGSFEDHLGYAFSLGDGYKASCKNVCDSVSYLLYNVNVRYYLCTNLDSIAFANDLLGGVEVTVPNDDLAEKYPEMTEGARVKLTDKNVSDFLRSRDTRVDFSNNGRMQRQQAFLDGFVERVKSIEYDEYLDMWDKLKSEESNIVTNMSKKRYLKLIVQMDDYSFDSATCDLKIQGTDKIEDGHDVFYADEEKLKQLVVDTFYVEQQ